MALPCFTDLKHIKNCKEFKNKTIHTWPIWTKKNGLNLLGKTYNLRNEETHNATNDETHNKMKRETNDSTHDEIQDV